MNAEHIRELLTKLGCQKIKLGNNGWVHATCPFAKWSHGGGYDNNPSFGIAVEVDGHSAYKCHGCQAQGDLVGLVFRLGQRSKKDLHPLIEYVREFDTISPEAMKKRIEGAKSNWDKPRTEIGGLTLAFHPKQIAMPGMTDDAIPESELEALQKEFPEDVYKYLTSPAFRSRSGAKTDSLHVV
jgi:hypothetical protein